MNQTAAVGWDVLVVTRAQAEKGVELFVTSTEPPRGVDFLEAVHTSDPAFHAAMILLQPIGLADRQAQTAIIQGRGSHLDR